jgi:PAS domain S-box-containing protein
MTEKALPLVGAPDGAPVAQPRTPEEAEAILKRLAGAHAPPPPGSSSPRAPAAPLPPAAAGGTAADSPAPADARGAAPLLPTAELFHDLLEAVPDALVITGPGGHILLINSQAERLFGYRREELVGRPVEVLVPERFRDGHVGQRAGYYAAPRVRPMGQGRGLWGRCKDGREVPVEISLSPLATPQGLLVLSTLRDVSERQRAEAQLRKLEARYRTLVEGIPAVTFMAALDESANELYVSPQIEELLGFSQQQWLSNPVLWYTQLHPDDRTRWHAEFARTCAEGKPFRSVYRFLSRDGRVVWVHGEAEVVRDEDGRPLFLQGVAFDITGIKQAEEELRALNQTLELRVAERTAEAEQRSGELARSNAELELFGRAIAHDLREPLRTMTSYIQKLAGGYQGRLDAQADDYITRSVNAGGRMRALIDDVLAYSRVRTHGREPSPTDSAAALEAARANLQATLDESGAAVSAGALPTVLADPTQLAQLFQNLLANALKFRADRPPRIVVRAERQGDDWLFAIADNGIGIDGDGLKRLFLHIGVQARLHTRSEYPGTGFGLATCKRIVERHGGRIWVESAGPGQGSTFFFTLPAGGA